jgi:DNA-binding MarR family transcriptional regulator
MSLDELKKMAEGKHEDLPVKKEEVDKSKEGKEVAEKIDARKKIFKEKLRKLAYEKAKRMNKTDNSVAEKNLETITVKNTIKINPEIREYRALNTFKKYNALMEQQDNPLEQQIVDYLKEGTAEGGPAFAALGVAGEHDAHGNTVDYPASASSIARAFQISPAMVQEVLDKMTRMGTITRVGDAYSYGSVEVANA